MKQHTPPIAKKQPHKMSMHGDERIDNYYWMRLSDEQKESKKPDEQTKGELIHEKRGDCRLHPHTVPLRTQG